jgi:energy-converting hydrogenase Eha subunit E
VKGGTVPSSTHSHPDGVTTPTTRSLRADEEADTVKVSLAFLTTDLAMATLGMIAAEENVIAAVEIVTVAKTIGDDDGATVMTVDVMTTHETLSDETINQTVDVMTTHETLSDDTINQTLSDVRATSRWSIAALVSKVAEDATA